MNSRVLKRKLTKEWRHVRRAAKKSNIRWYAPIAALVILILIFKLQTNPRVTVVDPLSYGPLLSTIANGESKSNYNAYFGNASNTQIDFTQMTVGQVLQWQKEYVDSGSPSSAVGKYQIIRPTLNGLINQMNVSHDQKFDAALQDKMAIALLERRGSVDYVDNKLTREQFAANLAQEWAALPKVIGENPEQSYYAGDGLNASHIGIDAVLSAVGHIKKM